MLFRYSLKSGVMCAVQLQSSFNKEYVQWKKAQDGRLPLLGVMHKSTSVGLAIFVYICTVYDRIFGDFPANNTLNIRRI